MDRDKFLTEAMGGVKAFGCKLDLWPNDEYLLCVLDDPIYTAENCSFAADGKTKENCGEWDSYIIGGVEDFSIWQGFGKLWEWAKGQKWWGYFLYYMVPNEYVFPFINPDRFANAVYEFLKERDK